MEEIFSTDETKKKAIKYVLEIGRNRNNRISPRSNQRLDKSASPPMKVRGGYIRGNIESFRTSPNNNFYNGRAYNISITSNKYPQGNDYNIGPKTVSNFYNPNQLKTNNYIKINDNQDRNQNYDGENEEYYESQPNYANINQQDRNDYDLISVNNIDEKAIQGMKYARSPEPRMANRIIQSLNDSYERASRRSNLPQRRNKDIQMMPRQRKQYNTSYFSTNTNNDDDVSELIRSIEELQSVINGQKNEIKNNRKDIINKNKEINYLKNELEQMQKELEDKRVEHDKEIEDIFNNNNSNPKLKNEYYKLLQDYENNVNDFNNVKDEYNKMVDEYNNLKKENENLKQNNTKIRTEYNNVKNEANKAFDDYNSIVDDYNKLDQENQKLKEDYNKLKLRNKGQQVQEGNDEEYTDLKNENDLLKKENEELRNDIEKSLSQDNKDYQKIYEENKALKNENDNLKKENKNLKNDLVNNKNNNIISSASPFRKDLSECDASPIRLNEEMEEPIKLQENYNKLKEYYKTLANEYNKLKNRNSQIKKDIIN
jgi:epidermal growth factor receptor substrate 15